MPTNASEQALWIALDAMPVAVSWATLADMKIVFMNRTFTEMFGYVVSDFPDIPAWTLKYPHPDERERTWGRWREYFDHPDNNEFLIRPIEVSVTCKDGTIKTVIHSGIILPQSGWALAIFIDITQRKRNELLLRQAEERARQSEALYRLLLEHSQEMVVLLDLNGNLQEVSPSAQKLIGWTPEEYLSLSLRHLIHRDDLVSIREAVHAIKRGMIAACYRGRIRHKDGGYRWVEALFQVYEDAVTKRPAGYTVTIHDITEQKRQEELLASMNRKLSEDATHDELTGLPNRRLFHDALDKETLFQLRTLSSTSLMMLDLDHFKQYNDTYGHLAGDKVLKQASAAIAGTLQREGDLAARFGGEEFVALLPSTTCAGAEKIANSILEAVRALNIPHEKNTAGIVTISIGVACWPAGSRLDAIELLKQADSALYRAKESGRDSYQTVQCHP